jgi:predicted dehydrogenase
VAAKLRIGLVGLGPWGRHILRDLLALDCEVCVAVPSESSRKEASDAGAAAVADVEEIPEVDGVVIAVPATLHYEIVRKALPREVPVFVEKPLTADLEQARRLAAEGDGGLFVMDKWRYHPGIEELARIARGGELGSVVGLRSIRAGWGNTHRDVDSVWVLLPHDLAIALEVLGELPPAAAASAELIGNEMWGLQAMLGRRPWLVIEVTGASPVRRREIRLVCEQGIAWLGDPYADSIAISRAESIGGEPELRPISTELPLLRELRAFVEHVRGGPPPRSSAAEGVLVIERLEELRRLALAP